MMTFEERLADTKVISWLYESKYSPVQEDCSAWKNEAKTLLYLVAVFCIYEIFRIGTLATVYLIIEAIS